MFVDSGEMTSAHSLCCHIHYIVVVTLQNSSRVVDVVVAVAAVAAGGVDFVVVVVVVLVVVLVLVLVLVLVVVVVVVVVVMHGLLCASLLRVLVRSQSAFWGEVQKKRTTIKKRPASGFKHWLSALNIPAFLLPVEHMLLSTDPFRSCFLF